MATKVIVTMVDDLDGKSPSDETVHFRLDGVNYEIDLSTQNAKRLRQDLNAWIGASRRVGGRRRGSSKSARSRAAVNHESAAIREWGRRHGYKVPARGRIPRALVDAFASSAQ
jgi:hypothetical protein